MMSKYDTKELLKENKELLHSNKVLRKSNKLLQGMIDDYRKELRTIDEQEAEQDPWYRQPVTYGDKLSEL